MSAGGWEGAPPKEVCIVMLSAIGDAVHVLPVANALKRTWPETRITWVIQPVPHKLVQGHPAIDDFIVFERRSGLSAWASTEREPVMPSGCSRTAGFPPGPSSTCRTSTSSSCTPSASTNGR